MLDEWLRIGDRALAFSRPALLPLALGALLILALGLVTHLRRRAAYRSGALAKVGAIRLWIATLVRASAYLLAVAALCGASFVETEREDRIRVVTLVDASKSMNDSEVRWTNEWLDGMVDAMRSDDELSLLRFGRTPVLEAGPGKPELPESEPATVDGESTNLMAAIESGASLASGPGGVLVLVSDGNQTAGDASAAAESARRHGVPIFPVVPPRAQAPLRIENVSAPKTVRQGQEIRMDVAIANRGSQVEEATLVARQGDVELGRVPLRISPGRSVVDASVRAGAPGHYAVTVDLEGADGVASLRASKAASLTVLGRPRILLVASTAAFEPLLDEAGFTVERRPDLRGITTEQLARYHGVVIGDVSASDLPRDAQSALERYVRDLGGGLLLAAGRELVSDTSLRGSPLERLMPVRLKQQEPKRKVRESLALFLVIDRSSSMTYGLKLNEMNPSRISYAREAALALISQLEDRDLVGAAAFDTETSLLSSLKPLSSNRQELSSIISRLVPSGGTDFKEALEIAARQLIASPSPTKHIILLTDGASIRPAAEHDAVIEALAKSGVSVTSIRIGDDKDSFDLVQKIAKQTGGTFYHVKDAVSLPNLMISDTRKRARREEPALEERTDVDFRPKVRRNAQALGGLRSDDMPVLHAIALTPLKSGAEEWLGTDHTGRPSPVLAAWQNGLGRVAVFTANPSHEWQSWRHARRFWSQLIRWVARPQSGDEIRLEVREDDGRSILALDTFDLHADGTLLVRVTDREGQVHELRPTATRPRHFETALPPRDTIDSRVEVVLQRGSEEILKREEWLPRAAAVELASGEDPQAEPNWGLLEQIAEITGGDVNAPLGEILKRAPAERQIVFPLAEFLATAAFLLIVLDIAVRYTRWA